MLPRAKLVTRSFCILGSSKKAFILLFIKPSWNSEKLLPPPSISKDNWRFCFPLWVCYIPPNDFFAKTTGMPISVSLFTYFKDNSWDTGKKRINISWTLVMGFITFCFLRKHSSSSEEKRVFVKKITDLSNVLWLAHGRAWIETQVCLIPKLTVFFSTPCSMA